MRNRLNLVIFAVGVTFFSMSGWTQAIGNGGEFSSDDFRRYVGYLYQEMKDGIFSADYPQFVEFGKGQKEFFLLDGSHFQRLNNSVLILKVKNDSAPKDSYCVLAEKQFLVRLKAMEDNDVMDKFIFYENLEEREQTEVRSLIENLQTANGNKISSKCLM
ncbi:MAG: hypothetical protein J0M15_07105 [Deltaproteobacteria bacterium]|jgi:hypothetical protein|nr:hypothetical protein [Deltaproteobacteria bacterium]